MPTTTAPETFVVLGSKVSPISVVMPCRLLTAILSTAAIASRMPVVTDFVLLAETGTDFSLLPIVFFFAAMGLTAIVAAAAWACVVAFGNSANTIIVNQHNHQHPPSPCRSWPTAAWR